jgi:predicted small metal-binding protein
MKPKPSSTSTVAPKATYHLVSRPADHAGDRFGQSAELAPTAIGRDDGCGFIGRFAVALRIVCLCGYVIEGNDDDELWRRVQHHMAVLHPELVASVTRDDILAQAERL